MKPSSSSWSLGAIALSVVGCGGTDSSDCTLLACASSFVVDFVRTGAWNPGEYRIRVVTEDRSVDCTTSLPLSCNAPSPCPADANVQLLLVGCNLAPSEHYLGGVEFAQGATPASVTVSVFHDEQLLGEGSYRPTYTTSNPNGPDCEPTCRTSPPERIELP
ncbi:hypothetical protein [Chondromyces crocatus]|uniref:Lipoprotein n=1 Tax=Chondromyces crocatus TaxID=52 RepID=A0A0K1E796_CHOCO|nr:hypothetical protein [Chondromyces crocatus]AKT36751.1 uncharacterized protein CMC5_008720 [Chondromyces crocatus]